jgi:AcrR family transcriptional regulator
MIDVPRIEAARARRWELYAAARPVFERVGFRASTVAELAWAAGLRPASLYHYFTSKAAFALFPLSAENGLCAAWHAYAATLPPDPVVRLAALLDYISAHMDSIGVALSLANEMADDGQVARVARAAVAQAQGDFRLLAKSLDPDIASERADDLFQGVAVLAAGRVPGITRDPAALRRQLADVARGWLTSLGTGAAVNGQESRDFA